jgi:hypothetical protein
MEVEMEATTNEKSTVWRRLSWDWVWHLSAYSLLILNTIVVYNSEPKITNFSFFLMLSAVLGLWYIPFLNISTLRIWANPKRGVLYLIPGGNWNYIFSNPGPLFPLYHAISNRELASHPNDHFGSADYLDNHWCFCFIHHATKGLMSSR